MCLIRKTKSLAINIVPIPAARAATRRYALSDSSGYIDNPKMKKSIARISPAIIATRYDFIWDRTPLNRTLIIAYRTGSEKRSMRTK